MPRKRHKLAGEYTVLGYLYHHHSDKRYQLAYDRVNMATLRFLVMREFVILRDGMVKITPRGMARWQSLDHHENRQHKLIGEMMNHE